MAFNNAIIMKEEIKDRHNTLIYSKSNLLLRGCSNSYSLCKFCMINIFYTEMASTYSNTPSEPSEPDENRGKMFQMTVID